VNTANYFLRVLIIPALLAISACQSTPPSLVSRYASDPAVQERLMQIDAGGIGVAAFSSDIGSFGSDLCKAQPIRLPRGETMAVYLRSAFELELARAARLDPESDVFIWGTVKRVRLRSDGQITTGAIGGTWLLELEIHSSNGRSFSVGSGSAYRTGFQTINCPEAARALMPAVQKLVRAAVLHDAFPSLLK
jgi:hypothetical protein